MFLSSSTTRIDRLLIACFLAAQGDGWQREQECGALCRRAVHENTSSVYSDDVVYTVQTDGASVRALRRRYCSCVYGPLKNPSEHIRWNRGALVGDLHSRFFLSAARKFNNDSSTRFGEFDCSCKKFV